MRYGWDTAGPGKNRQRQPALHEPAASLMTTHPPCQPPPPSSLKQYGYLSDFEKGFRVLATLLTKM
jgi:hypothetical protein